MLRVSTVVAILGLVVATSHAQAPELISFQGRLADSLGSPVDSTAVSVTFKLFADEAGSTVIWSETQSVDVVSGIFNVDLGKTSPLDSVIFNAQVYLGVELDGEPSGMTPQAKLGSSPYALGLRGMYAFWATDEYSNASFNLVGGGANNSLGAGVVGATIGGGGGQRVGGDQPNTIAGDFGTISGGAGNSVGLFAGTVGGGISNNVYGRSATIAGGEKNVTNGRSATVAGGEMDSAFAEYATVCGGLRNAATGFSAIVAGGQYNKASGDSSTVSGGGSNMASGRTSTVSGGLNNSAGQVAATVGGGFNNSASGNSAIVGGGGGNSASGGSSTVPGGLLNVASGSSSTVGGGQQNTASGGSATVPGGIMNIASGSSSFAAGEWARALHDGSFVWQDGSPVDGDDALESFAANQFRARASGGFYFQTAAAPNLSTGATLPAGSGAWTALSSKASKTNFGDVDALSYLDRVASLDLKEWSYKTEAGVSHVGPMAEDFYAAFGHGPTETGISTVDGDGVALAAIQGLYELVQQQAERITELERRLVEN